MKISSIVGFAAAAIVALTSAGTLATPTSMPDSERGAAPSRMYLVLGTAEIISNITHDRQSILVSGFVTADSLEDARSLAKDALAANAAIWGQVVAVYVSDVR